MTDEVNDLRRELQARIQELEALSLEVTHLKADLQVKEEYIMVLLNESPGTPAEALAARRYLAARARIRTELQRHPIVWRLARPVVHLLRQWRSTNEELT